MSPARARTRTTRSGVERTNHEATAPPQILPKRQSNVNLYLSSFPGEKVCFHTQICKMENARKCIEEALDSLNIRCKSRKIIQMEEQERAVRVDFGE